MVLLWGMSLKDILYPLLEDGRIERISGKVIGCTRPAPEGTWMTGGGIELPCKYKLYGERGRTGMFCQSFSVVLFYPNICPWAFIRVGVYRINTIIKTTK